MPEEGRTEETFAPLRARTPLLLLGLASATASVLASQLVLSRFLGATIGYYFAFVLVSFAMLGLAFGALAVHFLLPRMGVARAPVIASLATAAGAVSLHFGMLAALQYYVGVLGPHRGQDLAASGTALVWLFVSLLPFYLFTGFAVSLMLAASADRFHAYYAVDLVGAAAGCALAILALSGASPVRVAFLVLAPATGVSAAVFALASRARGLALASCALSALLLLAGRQLCESPLVVNPPHADFLSRPRLLTAWNSFTNVTVHPTTFFSWALSPSYRGPVVPMLDLMIDGLGGTKIARFDGDVSSLRQFEYLDADLTALVDHLPKPPTRQLVIGPGGGVDLLQAARAGRSDVTAVEVNPLVVSVVNEAMAEFSGRPYALPGVRLFVENGRTFVRRSPDRWDLVTLTWVDAGGSASALAASENYLYTVEAFEDYLAHLSPVGYVAFTRALGVGQQSLPIDTLRGVSVAVAALGRRGATSPGAHVLVGAVESPFFPRAMCYVLIKASPFTVDEIRAARTFCRDNEFTLLWTPEGPAEPGGLPPAWRPIAGLMGRILVGNEDPSRLQREAAYDIAPSTDDNPFYFVERAGPNRQAGPGLRALAWCCALLAGLVLAFVGLPLWPTARTVAPLTPSDRGFLVYCGLLGAGFMLVEIDFFHAFGLVLGSPTWTLGTVLTTLLVASGAGSMVASRVAVSPVRLAGTFGALILALGAFVLARGRILEFIVGWDLPARVLLTSAVLAPASFLMGIPMAAGMSRIGDRPILRMWGWAANGALAVLASVAAVLLAIHFGISATFLIGLAVYALAAGALVIVISQEKPQAAREGGSPSSGA
ncbi:MAG: hypothetical protein U0599_14720 [Vicinamibacteria bacterium]